MWCVRAFVRGRPIFPSPYSLQRFEKFDLSNYSKSKLGQIQTLQVLKARPKKKKIPPRRDAWSVVGYSTADEYNLMSLAQTLSRQGYYEALTLSEDLDGQCLCVRSIYSHLSSETTDPSMARILSKDIFFFADGSVIFWNMPHLERTQVLDFIRRAEDVESEPFELETIEEESEKIGYSATQNEGVNTTFNNGTIKLQFDQVEDEQLLEKYAFSNAIAASVKLGMLEAKLDRLIDSIEFVVGDLKADGRILMSEAEVLKKTGEIFSLKSEINLRLDLLDTPDFYWDRENLETLYNSTCKHLTIRKRTDVINQKLNHCSELMELLSTHLKDKHHVKLEWYIIVLIMVEVGFELAHFLERYV